MQANYSSNALLGFGGAVGVSNLRTRVGTNLVWTPLNGFDIGAEFMYVHLNQTRPARLASDAGSTIPAWRSSASRKALRPRSTLACIGKSGSLVSPPFPGLCRGPLTCSARLPANRRCSLCMARRTMSSHSNRWPMRRPRSRWRASRSERWRGRALVMPSTARGSHWPEIFCARCSHPAVPPQAGRPRAAFRFGGARKAGAALPG
jgi:hypothetical protein